MSYTVEWEPSAEADLAQIWNNVADRNAVTSSANAIDRLLQRDPYTLSQSRSPTTRILIMPPLAVFFEVDEPDQRVRVWAVGRSRRRS
jgi:plasmid stabilization system protein ParE